MQETKPYIPLYAAVWWEAGQHAFVVEMRSGDGGDKPGALRGAVAAAGSAYAWGQGELDGSVEARRESERARARLGKSAARSR